MNNISLIGFMGCGKTTIGRLISYKGKKFHVDLDEEISSFMKMTVSDIFQEFGEDRFREVESQMLAKALDDINIVLSCGGGIIKRNSNIKLLKEKSHVIYLKADVQHIMRNLESDDNSRPLLNDNLNKEETIRRLLSERIPIYENSCHQIIPVSGREIGDIINEINIDY